MSGLDFKQPSPLLLEGNLKENFKKFKQMYEIYATATKTTKEEEGIQVARFLSCAGEAAIELYNTFKLTDEQKTKIAEVTKAFEEYCDPRSNEVYERYKFYTRCQRDKEPFDHFMADISKLVENCNFGEQKESMLRDRIVIGIADQNLQAKLLKIDELTLEKAKEYCRVAEITDLQAKQMQEKARITLDEVTRNQGSSSRIRERQRLEQKHKQTKFCNCSVEKSVGKNGSQSQTGAGINCKYCGRVHSLGNCPAYGKICSNCNLRNHFANVCRRRSIAKVSDIKTSLNAEDFDNSDLQESDGVGSDCDAIHVDSVTNEYAKEKCWYEKVDVGGTEISFKLDSGAEVNVLPKHIFDTIETKAKLKPSMARLEGFGGNRIKPLGCVNLPVVVNSNKQRENLSFTIVDIKGNPILGLQSCIKLGLIKRINEIKSNTKEEFIRNNNDLFTGFGKYPEECILKLKEGAIPVHKPPRRVPLGLREKLKKTLQVMENRGVIEKKHGPSAWAHNLVIVEKKDGSLRLCLDPKELNDNITFEHFLIPTLEDFRLAMRDKKFFTVLDLKEGFWQLPLSEESKNLTAFSTPFGTYRYNVLPFGVSTAPEKFQKLNAKYFGNLPGCFVYIDDVIVGGETLEEHNTNLQRVMDRARAINVKFNPSKLQYCVRKVRYLGHIFTAEGIAPDPDRIQAIQGLNDPQNKKDLERILGMLNYLREFIPNYSERNAPLRALLKKNVAFNWTSYHSQVYKSIKELLSSAIVLHSFDPKKEIVVQTDASKNGLGCALLQEGKPIAFASKSLTNAELNYAQIEKELLAIVFATKKFHNYIYGHHIIVHTDHKPLLAIIRKAISDIPSTRLQRMSLKLQKYDLELKYIPGKYLHVPDLLSRNSSVDSEIDIEDVLTDIVHSINMSDNKKELFIKHTEQDEVLQNLIHLYRNGWPKSKEKIPDNMKFFWNVKDKIYYEDDLVFYENRIFVPKSLIKDMLNLLHEPHLGVTKTIARAKTLFYWPFMNRDICNIIQRCAACEKFRPSNIKQELITHEIPELPFQKIGIDILEYAGKYFLIAVDYFSKWLEIKEMKGKKAYDVMEALKKIFVNHGIPQIIVADNQPFNSFLLKDFANQWNFKLVYSSPRYPRSNGLAEKGVHIAKMLLKKVKESNTDFYSALLEQRCSVIPRLGYAPCEMLMSRKLRTKLPISSELLKPKIPLEAHEKLLEAQKSQKKYHDSHKLRKNINLKKGDNVVYRKGKTWEPGKVIGIHENPRSYIIRNENNQTLQRNTHHLRRSFNEPQFKDDNDEFVVSPPNGPGNDSVMVESPPTVQNTLKDSNPSGSGYTTRYGRIVKIPNRYQPQ